MAPPARAAEEEAEVAPALARRRDACSMVAYNVRKGRFGGGISKMCVAAKDPATADTADLRRRRWIVLWDCGAERNLAAK